jgi:hypothetical protein
LQRTPINSSERGFSATQGEERGRRVNSKEVQKIKSRHPEGACFLFCILMDLKGASRMRGIRAFCVQRPGFESEREEIPQSAITIIDLNRHKLSKITFSRKLLQLASMDESERAFSAAQGEE